MLIKNILKYLTCILAINFIILNGACARFLKSRSYTKKSPYSGFGKPSKSNGLLKCKGISGYSKRTSKGFTYVNPYARSK